MWLRNEGALDVTLACTHVINVPHPKDGKLTVDRLREAGVGRIVTTDSIENQPAVTEHIVPVSPIFARGLLNPPRHQIIE